MTRRLPGMPPGVKIEDGPPVGARTKLVGLTVNETSGVDHPATMTEGWLILKQAGATTGVRSVPGRLVKTAQSGPEGPAERLAAIAKAATLRGESGPGDGDVERDDVAAGMEPVGSGAPVPPKRDRQK